MAVQHLLQELARQVRERTMQLLAAAPAEALLWSPPGTQNHILWHAGHAVWLMDVLGVEILTGRSELPAGWAEIFGMNCRPPSVTRNWPSRTAILDRLRSQLHRYLTILDHLPDDQPPLPEDPVAARRSVVGRLLHGLHDEACHSGEMYLLLKAYRGGSRS
ncbi:MAG: DinB family protein [Gemmatales bacterium]|nr:DinB family protein [Gemmatales bacterium]MDW8387107.1 DinB family protein [Gemmatales bacterium]